MWIGARGADGSGRGPISMFARLTHRQLLRLVPVAKVTDHFHTDWYRNRAALRQGLSILDGIFIVEGGTSQKSDRSSLGAGPDNILLNSVAYS
jgi:hypothetical protein